MVFTSSIVQALEIPLSGPMPPLVQEIELSYVGEQTLPTATLNGPPDTLQSLPYRPFVSILNLLPSLVPLQVFGSCQGHLTREGGAEPVEMTFREGGNTRCGQRVGLQAAGGMVDVLSYQVLRLRGRAAGRVTLVLEDRAAASREDNLPLATVTGSFDLTIPLRQIGRHVDLRKLTALVVTTDDESARLVLEQFEVFQEPPATKQPARVGFWVWRYHTAVTDPAPVLAACKRHGCSRILIQMPALSDDETLWTAYAQFFLRAFEEGIDVMALDGYPEAIQEPQKLADKIHRLLHLVEPRALAGMQFDIEPYLLPGFFGDESGPRRYLEAIDVFMEAIGGRTRLSMVIPFWLASPTVGGRPLAYAVMDRVDEVAVMSYRTNLDELREIAEDTLRYGDLIGVPVWLAVETTALPVEQRVVLKRDPRRDLADAVLDYDRRRLELAPFSATVEDNGRRDWFRIHHRITVRPERLTFAGRPRAEVITAVKTLLEAVSHRSFAGVVIHDLDGFRALPE